MLHSLNYKFLFCSDSALVFLTGGLPGRINDLTEDVDLKWMQLKSLYENKHLVGAVRRKWRTNDLILSVSFVSDIDFIRDLHKVKIRTRLRKALSRDMPTPF